MHVGGVGLVGWFLGGGGGDLVPPNTHTKTNNKHIAHKNKLPLVPVAGSFWPAAICALAYAAAKSMSMPITSPVDRISGPSSVSAPGNLLNGSTTSLTATCAGIGSSVNPSSGSVLPLMTREAYLAIGWPTALATKGTLLFGCLFGEEGGDDECWRCGWCDEFRQKRGAGGNNKTNTPPKHKHKQQHKKSLHTYRCGWRAGWPR